MQKMDSRQKITG